MTDDLLTEFRSDVPLPDEKSVILGVIDVKSNYHLHGAGERLSTNLHGCRRFADVQ